MKIRKAGEYMHEIGAFFLFTGEVLGQRPMSQHRKAIELIDRDSGLQGYILRPLSAAHFEPTIPEKRGWIDRSKLLGISGRSRKEQISLATEKGIQDYPCPAGGCLLTDKNFADRMGDYFTHAETASMKDIPLLKVGRHFRLENGDKVIVARNEQEGKTLKKICPHTDHLLSPVNFSGPVVVLQGTSLGAAVEKMLEYTKRKVSEDARIAHRYSAKSEILCHPRVPLPLIRQPKVVSAIPPH